MFPEDNENNEQLSENPEENIRLENELLKLKMMAQFGSDFSQGESSNVPPEIMNQFLKNVIQFEENYDSSKEITVGEKLGHPTFPAIEQLSKAEIKIELDKVLQLLGENNIALDICDGPYDDKVIYDFIINELFQKNIDDMFGGFNGTCHFIYEEFHPNHKADITKRTKDFFRGYFKMDFNIYSSELSNTFILTDQTTASREHVLKHFQEIFDSFAKFEKFGIAVEDVKFELYDVGENDKVSGMGHAEGVVRFDAMSITGEKMAVQKSFILYMAREYDYWTIVNFEVPFFDWSAVERD